MVRLFHHISNSIYIGLAYVKLPPCFYFLFQQTKTNQVLAKFMFGDKFVSNAEYIHTGSIKILFNLFQFFLNLAYLFFNLVKPFINTFFKTNKSFLNTIKPLCNHGCQVVNSYILMYCLFHSSSIPNTKIMTNKVPYFLSRFNLDKASLVGNGVRHRLFLGIFYAAFLFNSISSDALSKITLKNSKNPSCPTIP